MRLLERLLLLFLPSFIFVSLDDVREGAGLVLGVKASVRGTSREDRFAVLLEFIRLVRQVLGRERNKKRTECLSV